MATTSAARRRNGPAERESPPRGREPDDGLGALAAGLLAETEEHAPAPARAVGVQVQTAAPAQSLRDVLRRHGWAPLAVLFALNAVDELDRIAFTVLAPNIQRTFDLSDTALSLIASVGGVLAVLAAIPFAVLGDRRRRTLIAGVTGVVWAAFAFLTGVVRGVAQLTIVRIGSGVAKASVDPVHSSLLADYYPIEARGRVYAAHRSANPVAGIIGPIAAGSIAALVGGRTGWRWAFVLLAPLSILAAAAAFTLRDPRRGAQEREGARSAADEQDAVSGDGASTGDLRDDTPKIPLATGMRRLLQIRSLRFMFFGIGVLGFALFGAGTLFSLYFERQWGVDELGRGVIFTILAAGPLAGLSVGGVVGDRLFRHDPGWPLFLIGASIPAYGVITAGALYLPQLWMVIAVFLVAQAAVQVTTAPFQQMVAATAPPALRSLAFGSIGVFMVFFGGFLGAGIYGAISDATSPRLALSLLWVPGLAAGALIAFGARHVRGDIAMVAEDVAEAIAAAERRRQPQRNLLEVRNLDFSYGPVQVLFGVDLDVSEGEIIALLGTNGAGKSTLLRAITGLEHPTRGSIRFDGHDVTYLEAEQILGLGVAMMPGGRAVFPGMTVTENLRTGAFSVRRDRARVDADIGQVFEWFPVLAERRGQVAGTLSGGEQQMLALGKAFLLRPKLLCLDELSLGLAPVVVEQLLGIVRQIHARGTTVIVVEQSVNVALSLATTAVFMEKGEVRFRGPARDLLDRPDLLRSVFLEGATRRSSR